MAKLDRGELEALRDELEAAKNAKGSPQTVEDRMKEVYGRVRSTTVFCSGNP